MNEQEIKTVFDKLTALHKEFAEAMQVSLEQFIHSARAKSGWQDIGRTEEGVVFRVQDGAPETANLRQDVADLREELAELGKTYKATLERHESEKRAWEEKLAEHQKARTAITAQRDAIASERDAVNGILGTISAQEEEMRQRIGDMLGDLWRATLDGRVVSRSDIEEISKRHAVDNLYGPSEFDAQCHLIKAISAQRDALAGQAIKDRETIKELRSLLARANEQYSKISDENTRMRGALREVRADVLGYGEGTTRRRALFDKVMTEHHVTL